VVVTIRTTDGRELTKQLDYPKGDPRNPLTDAEIEQKFDALAAPILSERARQRVKDAVWGLEDVPSITGLMELCVADLR
jgi:2-methylcitrate dehydratase